MGARDLGMTASRPAHGSEAQPSERPAGAKIPDAARVHIGAELRAFYACILAEEQPPALLDLVARLTQASTGRDAAAYAAFSADLLTALPG